MKKYYGPKGIQAIDAIEAWNLGFHLGNVVKYVARMEKKTKDPRADIEKSIDYLNLYLKLWLRRRSAQSKKSSFKRQNKSRSKKTKLAHGGPIF